jgi:hypothetical protein
MLNIYRSRNAKGLNKTDKKVILSIVTKLTKLKFNGNLNLSNKIVLSLSKENLRSKS